MNTVSRLPIVLIETHSRCNCRCTMCDIWKSPASREFSLRQLEEQLPALERLGTKWVVFTGGEPLMHSDIFSLAAPLRERGIRVSLLSTGLLFERFAARIAAAFDDAILSLDGPPGIHDRIRGVPGAFDRITQGVACILGVNPRFPISSRCVVQRLNHDRLTDTAATARALGLRSISFLAADLTSNAFGRLLVWQDLGIAITAEQLPVLDLQLDALERDPFVSDSPRHLRRIGAHYRAYLGLEPPVAPHCNAPWVSAVIGVDGTVKPCFFQPAYEGTGPLDSVVNSSASSSFRGNLHVPSNEICRKCVCSLYFEQPA